MDKETFINELTINLKHLTNEIKAEEIAKYNELIRIEERLRK